MEEISDEQLASLVQQGNAEKFGNLVERYEAKLKRYARKFLFDYTDAEDLIQDVFIKAFINIQSFDITRSFNSWIYRIAHNEFINAIKKRGKEALPFFDADTLFPHPLSKDLPEQDLHRSETEKIVNQFLDELSPKYRESVVLYYLENLSYAQIAEILHIPISTVGVRINRAKIILQKFKDHLL